jgi:arabinose-5-phosphate isomerase
MGDALAVVLITKKKFKKSDFMKSHPGGALGQRLASRVGELMFETSEVPKVYIGTGMSEALREMDKFRLGAVMILDTKNILKGIITDGDIRHFFAQNLSGLNRLCVDDVMSESPHTLTADSFLYDALNLMEKYQITVLPIVDSSRRLEGLLHLHDILGKGSFKFNGGNQ